MLAIDDLRKLAEMQIRLLKMTSKDRDINLDKYKNLVVQIDKYDFEKFLSSLDQISAHNQSLEVELKYLEQFRDGYQQLLEQQLLFKKNCELYGNGEIDLSNLSIVDIDLLELRINNINGYLINKLNLDNCKNRIEKLNKELLYEEKNRKNVSNKLLLLEEELKNNFIDAEGRIIKDGNLHYVSVVSEYNELGLDVKKLISCRDELDKLLLGANEELFDVEEKLNVAEICYKSDLSDNNLRIFNEIKIEALKVRYKVSMLKILDLIVSNYDDYSLFKKKREDLLSLINNRLNCLNGLGVRMSIDPFGRIKIGEQLDVILRLDDGVENICRIKREISQLDEDLERFNSKNAEYMIQISNTKGVENLLLKKDDIVLEEVKIVDNEDVVEDINALDNQVVSSREIGEQFNIAIVLQKTSKVIKRVNEMVNSVEKTKQIDEEQKDVLELVPELVIVDDSNGVDLDNEVSLETDELGSVDSLFDNFSLVDDKNDDSIMNDIVEDVNHVGDDNTLIKDDFSKLDVVDLEEENLIIDEIDVKEDEMDTESIVPVLSVDEVNSNDLFATVDPFVETEFFDDRVDDGKYFSIDNIIEDDVISNDENVSMNDEFELDNNQTNIEIENLSDEMPDAFWVVDEEDKDISDEKEEVVLSFDEQVDKLLADENKNKTKKLVA